MRSQAFALDVIFRNHNLFSVFFPPLPKLHSRMTMILLYFLKLPSEENLWFLHGSVRLKPVFTQGWFK